MRRDEIENAFARLLEEMKPSESLLAIFADIFCEEWNKTPDSAKTEKASIQRQLAATERKIGEIVERIVAGISMACARLACRSDAS